MTSKRSLLWLLGLALSSCLLQEKEPRRVLKIDSEIDVAKFESLVLHAITEDGDTVFLYSWTNGELFPETIELSDSVPDSYWLLVRGFDSQGAVTYAKEYSIEDGAPLGEARNMLSELTPEPDVPRYKVTLSANDSSFGTVSKSPDKTLYDSGDSVILVAIPYEGYRVTGWKDDSTFLPRDTVRWKVTRNNTFQAQFVSNTAVSVFISISAGGTALPSENFAVENGADTTAQIVADLGYRIASVSVNGSAQSIVGDTMSLELGDIRQTQTVVIEFRRKKYELVLQSGTGGSVSFDRDSVEHGIPTPIAATADSGYRFDSWKVIAGQGNVSALGVQVADTTVTLTGDATLRALFTQKSRLADVRIEPAKRRFNDSVTLILQVPDAPEEAVIRYTMDGTDPTSGADAYEVPLVLRSTTTVRARAFGGGTWLPSERITEAIFTRNKKPAPQSANQSTTPFESPVILTIGGEDPDGSLVGFETRSLIGGILDPSRGTMAAKSKQLEFQPTALFSGEGGFEYRLQDNDSAWSDWIKYKVTVGANGKPRFTKQPIDSVGLANWYKSPLVATDPEGHSLSFRLLGSQPEGMVIDSDSRQIVWKTEWTTAPIGKVYEGLAIEVSDGKGGADTAQWGLRVVEHVWTKVPGIFNYPSYIGARIGIGNSTTTSPYSIPGGGMGAMDSTIFYELAFSDLRISKDRGQTWTSTGVRVPIGYDDWDMDEYNFRLTVAGDKIAIAVDTYGNKDGMESGTIVQVLNHPSLKIFSTKYHETRVNDQSELEFAMASNGAYIYSYDKLSSYGGYICLSGISECLDYYPEYVSLSGAGDYVTVKPGNVDSLFVYTLDGERVLAHPFFGNAEYVFPSMANAPLYYFEKSYWSRIEKVEDAFFGNFGSPIDSPNQRLIMLDKKVGFGLDENGELWFTTDAWRTGPIGAGETAPSGLDYLFLSADSKNVFLFDKLDTGGGYLWY